MVRDFDGVSVVGIKMVCSCERYSMEILVYIDAARSDAEDRLSQQSANLRRRICNCWPSLNQSMQSTPKPFACLEQGQSP